MTLVATSRFVGTVNSVRFRLIDWLRRIIDHLAKEPVKVLGGAQVHPQSARHLNDLFVSGIPDDAAEGEIYNTQMLASFQQSIGELNLASGIANFQPLISHRQEIPGPNHDLITHQKSPIGTVCDLSNVNLKAPGVES